MTEIVNEVNESTEVKEVLTEAQLFEKLVALYNLIWDIELDIKDLLDEVKEDGAIEDITLIKSIAKAKAYSKVGDLEAKAKKQLEKIEELVG